MKLPRILVNLKAYDEALGKGAVRIALAAKKVSEETGVSIGIAPQYVDLRIVSKVGIPTFSQHIDPVEHGAHTGSVTVAAIRDSGAIGSLLNHSEKRMRIDEIEKAIKLLDENELLSVVCANDPEVAKAVSDLEPDAVAVEPPELIGTGVSVSEAKPEIIRDAVSLIGGVVYVGAGISTGEDVERALSLGAYGVLLASAVAKSKNPYDKLLDLARGVTRALD